MMNYAYIVNGIVQNVVVADAEWVAQQDDLYVELTDGYWSRISRRTVLANATKPIMDKK